MSQGHCPQCEVLMINGIRCHETGCPEAWKDYVRECKECGCEFLPEFRNQIICTDCIKLSEDNLL